MNIINLPDFYIDLENFKPLLVFLFFFPGSPNSIGKMGFYNWFAFKNFGNNFGLAVELKMR